MPFSLLYGAKPQKAAFRCNNQKVNNHYFMLRLALIIELVPDKGS